ncbi:SAM domain (Sterile alpha motif) [Popillia japonica]|uniref:SAM domain (Sterile alpha motif) n=1 Tax=Popillia japonica TaxID=7064 RepID=A0AAW1IEW2_POPJA
MKYLDSVAAKLETQEKKKAKSMKERAKKDAEKRIKEYNKRQAKMETNDSKLQKRQAKEYKLSMISTLKNRMKSSSVSNLTNTGTTPIPRTSFSAIVSGGTVSRMYTSPVQKKAMASKHKLAQPEDDFKISEIEDGKRSVRSLKGHRRDSEVLFSGAVDPTRNKPKLGDMFNGNHVSDNEDETDDKHNNRTNLTRSISQPDFIHELNNGDNQEPASIFVRPGIGSLAFRKSITNTLQAISIAETAIEAGSIGSAGSLAARQRHNGLPAFDDELSEVESSEDDDPNAPLERFLTAWGLGEYMPMFEEQKIDLDTLMMLTESDIKSLKLPIGHHRKLVNAINERKAALESPGEVVDSRL